MREFSNRFCIIAPGALTESALLNDEPFIPSAAEIFKCSSKLTFSQTPSDSDAGIVWNMTFRGVAVHTDAQKWHGKKAFIGMIMTDGSVRYIGSSEEQPLIMVTPYGNEVNVVEASFKALAPLQL